MPTCLRSGASDDLRIEQVFCGGPIPTKVRALIAERAIPTIYGNYDDAIARDAPGAVAAEVAPPGCPASSRTSS